MEATTDAGAKIPTGDGGRVTKLVIREAKGQLAPLQAGTLGWNLDERDVDRAVAAFRLGLAMARRLGIPAPAPVEAVAEVGATRGGQPVTFRLTVSGAGIRIVEVAGGRSQPLALRVLVPCPPGMDPKDAPPMADLVKNRKVYPKADGGRLAWGTT